jgi:hypothetical protein
VRNRTQQTLPRLRATVRELTNPAPYPVHISRQLSELLEQVRNETMK